VRELATLIHGRPCKPMHIGGVDIDGVVEIKLDHFVLIEMTVERDLNKVRDDIIKLRTAKAALLAREIFSECYCIVSGKITKAMQEAGLPSNIKVFDVDSFSRIFFDFISYKISREQASFGSAINPFDGTTDTNTYVPVKYVSEKDGKEYDATAIADLVRTGRRIILLGEYGSGKSRCLREVFFILSDGAAEKFCYPMAIDLREAWGLKRGIELIRRHLEDLALDRVQPSAITALAAGGVALLIDGFDEIGSQAWSNDGQKLRAIRAQALQGVKDLIKRSTGGILVTGRDHYFPTSEEMFSSLGLDSNKTMVIKCKNEFSVEELSRYFQERGLSIDLPPWLPRRPLICQTISNLTPDQMEEMFGVGGGETEFWHHLMDVICERDARINITFDALTIRNVLVQLARLTRTKSANVGPISLLESQRAFEAVVGQMPIEDASAMLQRLPCLGRLSSESSDRQFVDEYILDGLRATDVIALARGDDLATKSAIASVWINPLDELGLRILSQGGGDIKKDLILMANRSLSGQNRVLGSDIVSALLLSEERNIDFKGLSVDQGKFLYLDMSQTLPLNLRISNSYFSKLILPTSAAPGTQIRNSVAERVFGASAASGLPSWVSNLDAEAYDSFENVSRIRKINLLPAHQVLVTIVKKTFFQKGAGRKEEALLRGLGQIVSPSVLQKILGILLREGCLDKFRGNDGTVYAPIRAQAGRMKQMLYNLRSSDDPIWAEVGGL
jgi:hypothetical protein